MSISIVSAAVAVSGGWTVFWVQLPVLVLAAAVIVALWRARPEDVPRVFEAFAAAFGRRPPKQKQPTQDLNTDKSPVGGGGRERMSRRPRRRDALSEYVADNFLKEDLRKAHVPALVVDYLELGSIEAIADAALMDPDEVREMLISALKGLRFSKSNRAVLATYLYEQEPDTCCKWCRAVCGSPSGAATRVLQERVSATGLPAAQKVDHHAGAAHTVSPTAVRSERRSVTALGAR